MEEYTVKLKADQIETIIGFCRVAINGMYDNIYHGWENHEEERKERRKNLEDIQLRLSIGQEDK